jgi:hypothetical protein
LLPLVVVGASMTPAVPAGAAPPLVSTSFGVGTSTYVVPPAVTRLLVDATGAAGGSDGVYPESGRGSRVVAALLVTPGETLTIVVGGHPTGLITAGTNGGGRGDGYGGSAGYGGGGGTDIRRGALLSGRVIVAGGGGGQGGNPGGGGGGIGGGTAGEPAHSTTSIVPSGATAGGAPGTLAAGGPGGTGTDCVECSGSDGSSGSLGTGGKGGYGIVGGGGGGGGGYYGGGGGAGSRGSGLGGGGGGGGGGSSYVSPTGAVLLTMAANTTSGHGSVVLTPDPTNDEAPEVTQVSPADYAVIQATETPRFTISAVDPDADLRWVGRVEIYSNTAGQRVMILPTTPAASGESASVSPPGPLPPGNYQWTAKAVDSRGVTGTAGPRYFTVAWPASGHPLVATGGFAFHSPASLPAFPCSPPPPFGTGPCGGSFSGDWSGQLEGDNGDNPFSVAWSAPAGRFQASFQYAEWQCLGLETVLGIARGTATAVAEPGEVQGKWQVPGESFPRDIVRVMTAFSFDWVRIGASAALLIQPFSLSLEVAGMGTQTIVTQPQTGTAAFVVTGAEGIGGTVPSCAEPLTNVQGHVVGTIPLVEVAT